MRSHECQVIIIFLNFLEGKMQRNNNKGIKPFFSLSSFASGTIHAKKISSFLSTDLNTSAKYFSFLRTCHHSEKINKMCLLVFYLFAPVSP